MNLIKAGNKHLNLDYLIAAEQVSPTRVLLIFIDGIKADVGAEEWKNFIESKRIDIPAFKKM